MVMEARQVTLIEDSETDAAIIKRIICENSQPDSYRLYWCETMFQAREYLFASADLVDVILLDLHLPDTLDGHDSFLQVKSFAPDIPVVVLTSCNNQQLVKSLLDMGADDIVSKSLIPTNPDLLCRAIDFSLYRNKRIRLKNYIGVSEAHVR
ncbi:MAG: hypothetical protein AUJ12_01265 [Alphaproteobacteria bacterium CG1_02_46_17]|nr:MAG: hypothetical protein AUJ12_01265 [Alphaproteobacteria bacterium CG1_02_46_17]